MQELIEYHVINRVAYITLNRPDKRNALNPELIEQLVDAVLRAGHDEAVKVIVIKANGEVFSAGADLEYLRKLQHNTAQDDLEDTIAIKELFRTIYTLPKFVIAQVEGHAIAGGCGLASVCDVVFAVPEAKFGYSEVKIGFIPALVACFLVRRIGDSRARELLMSGELIGAETACRYALVNFIENSEAIGEAVKRYAENLCRSASGQSIGLTKQLISAIHYKTLDEALEEAVQMNVRTRASADCKRGVSAFLNREKLEW